jgi:hypothetical protein
MLLLFILIGLLALGLPLMLMLFGDPPAPPPPPVQAKPAIVKPGPVAARIEVPQAASSETSPQASEAPMSATTAVSQVPQAAIPAPSVTSRPATPAGDIASVPDLPEGSKLPSDADLLKELQRLLDERAKSGK